MKIKSINDKEGDVHSTGETGECFNHIDIKHEPENGAHQQHYAHPFAANEQETTVKFESYANCNSYDDNPVANVVKSELIQFEKIDALKDIRPSDIKAVMLEKIPKTETKIIGEEFYSRYVCHGENNTEIVDSMDTYSDIGSNSDTDPERDPFGDIDCDPCFSQKQSSCNFSADDEIGNEAVFNHIRSTKATSLPSTAALNNNAQLQTVDSTLRCELCLETQMSVDKLQVHVKTCAHSHKDRRRFCAPCNKLYTRVEKLKLHALKIHGIKNHVDYRSFKCRECPRYFVHQESLLAHSALHQEEDNNPAKNENGLKRRPFKCPECSSSFPRIGSLTAHVQSHKNERSFKCPTQNCGKAFKLDYTLQRHVRLVHSEDRPFKCEVPNCGKAFKSKDKLKSHQVCHSEARPFKCPHSDCDQIFKNKKGVTSHLQFGKHVQERPFKCGQCDLAFFRNWHLTQHLETHAKGKEDSMKCPEPKCNKTFKLKHNLLIHLSTVHKETDSASFECPEPNCGKKFKSEKGVKDHLRYHTRPHKCKETGCSATFSMPARLNSHLKSKHKSSKEKRN